MRTLYLPFVFAVLLMAAIRVNTMSRLERVRQRWAQLKATQINYEEYKWELWLINPVCRVIPSPVTRSFSLRRQLNVLVCHAWRFFLREMRHLPMPVFIQPLVFFLCMVAVFTESLWTRVFGSLQPCTDRIRSHSSTRHHEPFASIVRLSLSLFVWLLFARSREAGVCHSTSALFLRSPFIPLAFLCGQLLLYLASSMHLLDLVPAV